MYTKETCRPKNIRSENTILYHFIGMSNNLYVLIAIAILTVIHLERCRVVLESSASDHAALRVVSFIGKEVFIERTKSGSSVVDTSD